MNDRGGFRPLRTGPASLRSSPHPPRAARPACARRAPCRSWTCGGSQKSPLGHPGRHNSKIGGVGRHGPRTSKQGRCWARRTQPARRGERAASAGCCAALSPDSRAGRTQFSPGSATIVDVPRPGNANPARRCRCPGRCPRGRRPARAAAGPAGVGATRGTPAPSPRPPRALRAATPTRPPRSPSPRCAGRTPAPGILPGRRSCALCPDDRGESPRTGGRNCKIAGAGTRRRTWWAEPTRSFWVVVLATSWRPW